MTDVQPRLDREFMHAAILRYFDGCNRASREIMASCLSEDAVHYFPPGMYGGPWRGRDAIAAGWERAVATFGSYWTVDRIACDLEGRQAVAEWTHFKTGAGTMLRGDEWYVFDVGSGLIAEIRAYYASPQDPQLERLELHDFDYAGRGYALEPPAERYPRDNPREAHA
jgi:methyltransferase